MWREKFANLSSENMEDWLNLKLSRQNAITLDCFQGLKSGNSKNCLLHVTFLSDTVLIGNTWKNEMNWHTCKPTNWILNMWHVGSNGSVYTQGSKHCHQKRTRTSRTITYITAIAMVLNTKIRGDSDDCTVLTCYAMIDVSKSTLSCYGPFFLLLCKKKMTPKCCLSTAIFCKNVIIFWKNSTWQ
mgnify:CR=1 FL=1